MNKFQIFALKSLRKIYQFIFKTEVNIKPECIQDADLTSQIIFDVLTSDNSCMIGRFGAFELSVLVNYLGVIKGENKIDFITLKQPQWWWENSLIKSMKSNAGFFPPTQEKIEKFSMLMLQDIPLLDVLGSWLSHEILFEKELKNCIKINFELLNPYFSKIHWTRALEGKKVLVVHPFARTIESQFEKRELLFKDNILPTFELKTIQAVQSIAGNQTHFSDWFEALDYMKSEIHKVDFDICLIGCGAYGFPLAAHVKRMGKKAVHMGGSLQLLFGIKGKRWENSDYNPVYNYSKLMNEHWVYPNENENPYNSSSVEGGCYW
jgi:hypothetical protein